MIDNKEVHLRFSPEIRDILIKQVESGAYTTMTGAASAAIKRQFTPLGATA